MHTAAVVFIETKQYRDLPKDLFSLFKYLGSLPWFRSVSHSEVSVSQDSSKLPALTCLRLQDTALIATVDLTPGLLPTPL